MLLLAALGVGALLFMHTGPAPFLLEASRPDDTLWHVPADPAARSIFLTYDDGPNPTATPQLLDVLRQEGAAATFFLIDDHLTEDTAPLVRRMFAEGHAVALHSNERWLMLNTPEHIVEALQRAADRVERLAGSRPCALFRPHAGWRSAAMYEALDSLDYRLAGWSWGSWDWNWGNTRDPAAIAERLARNADAGDVIVIHDGHHIDPQADRRYAVEATAMLVPALRAKQLRPERLPCG